MKDRIAKKKNVAHRVKIETREIRGGAMQITVGFDLPREAIIQK